jgi:hypothetical protein
MQARHLPLHKPPEEIQKQMGSRNHSGNDETLPMGQTRTIAQVKSIEWIHDGQLK